MSRPSRPTRSELAERLLDLPADEHLLENWARVARVDGEPFRHFQSLILELLRDQPLVARSLVQRLQSSGSVPDALSSALLTRLHAHACLATGAIPDALSAYETSWRTLSTGGHEQEAVVKGTRQHRIRDDAGADHPIASLRVHTNCGSLALSAKT